MCMKLQYVVYKESLISFVNSACSDKQALFSPGEKLEIYQWKISMIRIRHVQDMAGFKHFLLLQSLSCFIICHLKLMLTA